MKMESTALNPKIADLFGIPHNGCWDHGLNNGGKDMESETPELTQLCDDIHGIHVKVSANNKLSAALVNAHAASHHLKKIKSRAITRWNSFCKVVKSTLKYCNELKEDVKKYPSKFTKAQRNSVERSVMETSKIHIKYLQAI